MRLRFGVCMPEHGGRTAVVGVEVQESRAHDGYLVHDFVVGSVDRVTPFTVEAARDRVCALATAVADLRPCALVDTGSPQGLALRRALRDAYPRDLHRPHAYPGTGSRVPLFSAFLEAYSAGRVHFRPGLAHRAALDRALVFYLGRGVGREGVALESEDEALVVALGLAMFWPRHGGTAAGSDV